jgi:hypothetical protein
VTRDELIKAAAWAFYDADGPHSDDPHMWQDLVPHISAALDAVEPLIRADERENGKWVLAYRDALMRGLHAKVETHFREYLPPYLFPNVKNILFPDFEGITIHDAIMGVWQAAEIQILELIDKGDSGS